MLSSRATLATMCLALVLVGAAAAQQPEGGRRFGSLVRAGVRGGAALVGSVVIAGLDPNPALRPGAGQLLGKVAGTQQSAAGPGALSAQCLSDLQSLFTAAVSDANMARAALGRPLSVMVNENSSAPPGLDCRTPLGAVAQKSVQEETARQAKCVAMTASCSMKSVRAGQDCFSAINL